MDGAPATATEQAVRTVDPHARAIRCARCGHALTSTQHALEIVGRHAHVFMNPSGVLFPVRCFAEVQGAADRGTPTREATWFPGTTWTYAHCCGCDEQVGWRYVRVDADGAVFHGLIEDCIVEDR